MEIQRINTYNDKRFSQKVLHQHGGFLAEAQPFSVEIISVFEAVISGEPKEYYPQIIEEFRFYAEHISTFYDEKGDLVAEFPKVELFDVDLKDIQPSQFYADEEKVQAVSSFIHGSEDIIIPLMKYGRRYLSLDGHTRMYAAQNMGFNWVKGFLTSADAYIFDFAKEAQKRGVFTPYDLTLLSHEDYCIKWHKFCDDFFAEKAAEKEEK